MGGDSTTRKIVGEWDYHDPAGQVVYTKLKYEPKSFAWKNKHGYGLNGATRVPYNLPELLATDNRWVFLCEGEKDCSTLAKAGFVATTFGGSSDLPAEALPYFADKKVFILGDYDKAGAKRVKQTFTALQPIAKEVRHAWLQDPCQSETINDITDWFSRGGSVDKLKAQVKVATGYEDLAVAPNHTIFTYADILKMPPPKWLVHDYLLENSTAMLIGPSGSYKSFAALDLSLCVATGMDYHSNRVYPADVLYVAGEGSGGYRARIGAWKEHYRKDIDQFYLLPNPLDFMKEEVVDSIIEDIDTLKLRLGLFVVDTLARCNSGEENSASDMSKFVNNLDRIRIHTGCTILIVHHTGKNASLGARGSSSIYAAMDTSLEIAKQEMVMTVTCDKQKDAPPFAQRQFTMHEVSFLGGTSLVPVLDDHPIKVSMDDEMLAACAALLGSEGVMKKHADVPEGQVVLSRSRLREQTLDMFSGTGNTKSKAFTRVIERLIATNQICYAGNARSSQWLWLKEPIEKNENKF